MAEIDLTLTPWDRLAKLAPPRSTQAELQAAAQRHSTRTDVYAAAADLWEDLAMTIDLSPDCAPDVTPGQPTGAISKVSQDGISVEYKDSPLLGNNQSTRIAQHGQMMGKVRALRARSKPASVKVHDPDWDPFTGRAPWQDADPERIIPVIE